MARCPDVRNGPTLPLLLTRLPRMRAACGAHLLLQTRTRALDGTLRPLFERWYPGLANDNTTSAAQAAAA